MSFQNFNFLPVTEKAAIATHPFIGRLDKYGADDAATNAMRQELNKLSISAKVVIGEGEMDEAPMLYIGEELGRGGVKLDIAVDPLEGTNLTAKNQNNAITVIALTTEGGFLHAPDMYMKKIAVGKKGKGVVDINISLTENLKKYAKNSGKHPNEITIALLERERHNFFIKEVIEFGAKVLLLSDGDILPAILTGIENYGIDMLYGIGAAPEGVISAAALKCLGGDFQGILEPQNEEEIKRCKDMGIANPKNNVFTLNELVKTDEILVLMSAVTNSYFGKGVRKKGESLVVDTLKISSQEPKVQHLKSCYPLN